MAKYAIFYQNILVKIASSDFDRDIHLSRWHQSISKTITDTQWLDFFSGKKTATLEGDNIIEVTYELPFNPSVTLPEARVRDNLKQFITNQITIIESSISAGTSDPEWLTYLTKLKEIDSETVPLPFTDYFQTWFNSTYSVNKSILELP